LPPIRTSVPPGVLDLLVSVTGIADASAIQILGELLVLPPDQKAKPWGALAGLDPRVHDSGSSVHKKPRLTKAGNRYLSMALFRPALSATRHDPFVRGLLPAPRRDPRPQEDPGHLRRHA